MLQPVAIVGVCLFTVLLCLASNRFDRRRISLALVPPLLWLAVIYLAIQFSWFGLDDATVRAGVIRWPLFVLVLFIGLQELAVALSSRQRPS